MVRTSLEDVKVTVNRTSDTNWWENFETGLANIERKPTDQVEVIDVRTVRVDRTEDVEYDVVHIVSIDVDISGFMPQNRIREDVSEAFEDVEGAWIENLG